MMLIHLRTVLYMFQFLVVFIKRHDIGPNHCVSWGHQFVSSISNHLFFYLGGGGGGDHLRESGWQGQEVQGMIGGRGGAYREYLYNRQKGWTGENEYKGCEERSKIKIAV